CFSCSMPATGSSPGARLPVAMRVPRNRGRGRAMASVTARLIKGSLWLSFARAIVNGLAALSTFVLAWNLAPSDFGVVALGMTILMIVSTVTELSLAEALIRHEAPGESHFSA